MTTLLVWAISCAQQVASSGASGGALREAKNATKGLSNKSLFPDNFYKKKFIKVSLNELLIVTWFDYYIIPAI